MKKSITIIFVLIAVASQAQFEKYIKPNNSFGERKNREKIDSVFTPPSDTLSTAANGSIGTLNGILYIKDTTWKQITGSGAASWDSGKYHSIGYYDGRYQPVGNYVTKNIFNSDGYITDGSRTIRGNLGAFNIDSVYSFQINPNFGNSMTVAPDYFSLLAQDAPSSPTRWSNWYANTITGGGGTYNISSRGATTLRFDSSIKLTPLDSFFVYGLKRRARTTDKFLVYDTATNSFGYADGGSGGSGTSTPQRTIPSSAFTNKYNPTVKEANTYIKANFGSDTLGFFSIYPDSINAIERREIVPDIRLYNAFPTIARNPINNNIVVAYQQGSGHALRSTPAVIISTDGGKTFSPPITLETRSDGGDWKSPAIGYDSTGKLYAFYENGYENTLSLSLTTINMRTSTDDGHTWSSATTINTSSTFSFLVSASTYGMVRDGNVLMVPVYGLNADNDHFRAGVLRSTDGFATSSIILFPGQDSLTDKFNENTIVVTKDTTYDFVRSEGTTSVLYRSYTLDHGATWSSPVACNINAYKCRPNISVMPDGRMIFFSRINAGLYRGGIWVSTDNGLNWVFKGTAYDEERPFMYSAGIVLNNTLLNVYAVEHSTIPFSGGRCGIYLSTYPVNPIAFINKDASATNLIIASNNPHSITQNFKTFMDRGDGVIHGDADKPVTALTDSIPIGNDVAFQSGGDIMGNTGNSIIRELNNTGVRSSTFSNSPLQGAVGWSDTVGHIDSFTVSGRYITATVASGNIYFGNSTSSPSVLKWNPYTDATSYITSEAANYEGAATVGDYAYFLPNGSANFLKIDSRTDLTSIVTLPSTGWMGLNYAGGYLWSIKNSSSNEILKYDPKKDTMVVLTNPYTGSWAVGPFDGRYQWFVGYFTSYLLKLDVTTDEITAVGKDISLDYISGVRNRAVFDGVNIWANNVTANTIFVLNPNTLKSYGITLPAGSYPGIKFDGASIWAIANTGDVVKINPKTFEFKVIKTPDGGALHKWSGAVMYGNRVVLIPDSTNKIATIETVEFGADNFERSLGFIKQPLDSVSVGDHINNISIKNVAQAPVTSYANTYGTGDRSSSVATNTDLILGGTASTPRLINGDKTTNDTWWVLQNAAGHYIEWDFGSPQYITEIKYYQQDNTSHAVFQAQGSPNGVSWANIGSTFTLGGTTTQTITALSSNAVAYRYYRLLGVSGSMQATPYIYQFEFKIADGSSVGYIAKIQTSNSIKLQIQPDGGTTEIGLTATGNNGDSLLVKHGNEIRAVAQSDVSGGGGGGSSIVTNVGNGDTVATTIGSDTLAFKSDSLYSSNGSVLISKNITSAMRKYDLTVNTSSFGSLAVIDDVDYTITIGVTDVVYKHMTAGRTITLPSASTNTNRKITISNGGDGAFNLTLSASARENASTTTTTIGANHWMTIMSDGTEWWIVTSF